MFGVLANVRFPMPATFAFLAVGVDDEFCFQVVRDLKLRNIYQLTKIFEYFPV